jgi:hypothetical protein
MSIDIFNPKDGAIKAFATLSEMKQAAADRGLEDYITSNNADIAKTCY